MHAIVHACVQGDILNTQTIIILCMPFQLRVTSNPPVDSFVYTVVVK